MAFFSADPELIGLETEKGPVLRIEPDHQYLHEVIWRNECRGRLNRKRRRNGQDSFVSRWLRHGSMDGGGCFDTPFIDIDEIWVEAQAIVEVGEGKRSSERTDQFTQAVLDDLSKAMPVRRYREESMAV